VETTPAVQQQKSYLASLSDELGTRKVFFIPDSGSVLNKNVRDSTRRLLPGLGYTLKSRGGNQVQKSAQDVDELDTLMELKYSAPKNF